MSETIEVRYLDTGIKSAEGQIFYHKYILYTKSDGKQFYARGGTTLKEDGFAAVGLTHPLGEVNTEYGAFLQNTIDFPKDGAPHFSELIATGSDFSTEWTLITEAMDLVEGLETSYWAHRNSNSSVDTALVYAGLPLPTQDERSGDHYSPGSDNILPIGHLLQDADNSILDHSNNFSGGAGEADNADTDFENGTAIDGGNYETNMDSEVLNGDGAANATASGTVTDDYSPGRGTAGSSDSFLGSIGNAFEAVVDGIGSFVGGIVDVAETIVSGIASAVTGIFSGIGRLLNIDPLVADMDGDGVELTAYDNSFVTFDIDHDGFVERTAWVSGDDAMIVHDLNNDGIINDITEVLSEYYNDPATLYEDGFAALATLDSNNDGTFDAGDDAYMALRVWQDADEDGQTDTGELKTLNDAGVDSINLSKDVLTRTSIEDNPVFSQSTFMLNGVVHDIASVDFVSNELGYEWNNIAEGLQIVTEDFETGLIQVEDTAGFTVDLLLLNSDSNTNNDAGSVIGNIGDDVLIGDAQDNWLAGAQGSDILQGGAGDDMLVIDADDLQDNIDAGEGFDTIQVVDDRGVALNLKDVNAEIAIGGNGDDVFFAGGHTNAFIRGGEGNDIIIGGSADDALSGEDGDDTVDGGLGDDIIRGHRGKDVLIGDHGEDYLDGGLDDDKIYGGADDDLLKGGAGNDHLYGGEGYDIAEFSGKKDDYTITYLGDNTFKIEDTVFGRDGTDIIVDAEALNFADIINLDLAWQNPFAVNDVITLTGSGSQIIESSLITGNDTDFQNNAIHITQITSSVGGSASLNGNGDVIYTPDESYKGVRSFTYKIQDSDGNNGGEVSNSTTGESAEVQGTVYINDGTHPTDPLFYEQWYLNEINVLPVWSDYTGKGVNVAVYEADILDRDHFDLIDNIAQETLDNTVFFEGNHATLVSGIIAASNNGVGSIGVAYNTTLHAVGADDPEYNPQSYELQGLIDFSNEEAYDITNHSIGSTRAFEVFLSNTGTDQNTNISAKTLLDATKTGRDGLGTISIWAAGNERTEGRNTNDFDVLTLGDVIVVGGYNKTTNISDLEIQVDPFSTPGANILISAPSSNIYSTSRLIENSNGSVFGDKYEVTQGTSYATPIVSGVVSLMLEANPNLGYRDVQEILSYSARVIDENGSDWQTNGARNWNGGGLHFSHDYGFGSVDAFAAVRLAESWHKQETTDNRLTASNPFVSSTANQVIADNGILTDTVEIPPISALLLEHVTVTLDLVHDNLGDLIIKLISPSGTESILLNRQGKDISDASDRGHGSEDGVFTFSTRAIMGEQSTGVWTLEVTDAAGGSSGLLRSWEIDFSGELQGHFEGDIPPANTTYVYTDEYHDQTDSARQYLYDSGASEYEDDTLNVSAMSGDLNIDLTPNAVSNLAGTSLQISPETTIERLFTGDGNDILVGNYRNNLLWGGRGDDTINGGVGNDWLIGHAGINQMTGGLGNDRFVIQKGHVGEQHIQDFNVSESDVIYIANYGDVSDLSDLSLVQDGSDTRIMMSDSQAIILEGVHTNELDASHFIFDHDFKHFEIRLEEITLTNGDDNTWHNIFSGAVIHGLDGDDVIRGTFGDDIIYGDDGNDTLLGSYSDTPGWNNVTEPDGGNDVLYGGNGNDQLYGSGMIDILHGGEGRDILVGNRGNDILHLTGDGDQALGGDTADNDEDVYIVHRMDAGALGEDLIVGFKPNFAKIDLRAFSEISGFDDLIIQADTLTLADGDHDILRVFVTQAAVSQQLMLLDLSNPDLISESDFLFNELEPLKPKSDNFVLSEDSTFTFSKADILANDSVSNENIDFSKIIVAPQHGYLEVSDENGFVYTPNTDYFGEDIISYEIVSSDGLTATTNIFITIAPVSDLPSAFNDYFIANEDQAITGNVLLNDSDVDGDVIKVQSGVVTTAQGVAITLAEDGSFTYTPLVNFNGEDSFEYTLEDAHGNTETATATLDVISVNDAPVATDDNFIGIEDTVLTGNVLSNNGNGADGDPDGDVVNVVAVTGLATALGGSVDIDSDGEFTYTPAANVFGTDSFTYTLEDGKGGQSTATVQVTIADDPDTFNGDANDNTLNGTDGVDSLYGGAGNDILQGGLGDDSYYFTSGHDTIIETGGNDVLYLPEGVDVSHVSFLRYSNTPQDLVNLVVHVDNGDGDPNTALGTITVYNQFLPPVPPGNTQTETLRFQPVGEAILTDMRVTTFGGALDDLILGIDYGANPDDTILGFDDADTIASGAGNDSIFGGTGNDTLLGESGGDALFGEEGDDWLDGGSGDDFIFGDEDDDGSSAVTYGGADTLIGGDGADWLDGNKGNDTLHGGNDNDILLGNENNDALNGDAGDDFLIGGSGDDILNGGSGSDDLYSETGADTFLWDAATFNEADAVDNVYDFDQASGDKLDVSQLLSGYDPLTDAISDFVQITDDGTNSTMAVDVDGTANGTNFVDVAIIYGVTGLADEDVLETNGALVTV